MITAVILTHNNQTQLKSALASASFCQEVIVVDDASTDATPKLARKAGAKLFTRALNHDFAAQRNFALSQATHPWVLFLDPDEIIPPTLRAAILRALKDPGDLVGFYLRRTDIFLGTELTHGETGHIKLLRLARKTAGLWRRPVHEVWAIQGPTATLTPPLFHSPHPDLNQFLAKINFYTSIEATHRRRQGHSFSLLTCNTHPLGKFILNYFIKLGFLDGFPGLVMAYFMSLHSLIVRVKLYETHL
jgi:hypothetical protein